MNIIIDGFNKSIHKKDNQIIIKEKENILDSIKASNISSIVIIGKGYVTFDALTLISQNNIKLISFDYFGKLNYILESPDWRNVKLKKLQYQLSENKNGINIASEIIKSKMINQKSTLTTLNKRKKIAEVEIYKKNILKNQKHSPVISFQYIQKSNLYIIFICFTRFRAIYPHFMPFYTLYR